MDIKDLLVKDAMIMNLEATTKETAIDEMVQKLYETGRITDIDKYKKGILAREAQTSTGLGEGIAMPHAKNSAVKEATVLFAKSKKGVDYAALDEQPVYLFFMIAAPEGANDTHLQALAALSRLLIDPTFVTKLKEAQTPDEVQSLFQQAEEEKKKEEEQEKSKQTSDTKQTSDQKQKYVVAVTACPTGIAHTYMAEDALKKKAKELGIPIKVETNGSEGVKNRLTEAEIRQADGVIVAADKKVEMDRFDGKPLINCPVSDCIRKPEELIQSAINGKAPIFHGSGEKSVNNEGASAEGSIGSRIYKDLMNGVSHMLPFVIGGGIAIALSFMIDQFIGVPHDQLSQLGKYNQPAAILNEIGNSAFGFMLPVFAGFIASSIADRPGLIAGFATGALAITGGAGFLGALVGGFMAGYVIVFLKFLFKKLPKSLDGIKTILFYPVFGLLIAGGLMLLVNIPMKIVNDALNHFLLGLNGANAALLGALLAGMMAIDLGGPINKAAYVFGTASIASTITQGGSIVMASVMAGGMVPPLAIFLSTLFFKNKFTKDQKDAGLTNLVMGLSFVTEGAIPFAASDPLRVIPSFVIGSAITGALVGSFGIRLLAPHGGIFVALLLNHPILYLLFVLVGAVISSIVLGFIKKPVKEA